METDRVENVAEEWAENGEEWSEDEFSDDEKSRAMKKKNMSAFPKEQPKIRSDIIPHFPDFKAQELYEPISKKQKVEEHEEDEFLVTSFYTDPDEETEIEQDDETIEEETIAATPVEEKKQETSFQTAEETVGNEKNVSFVVKETLYPKNEPVKTPKETIVVSEETNKAELEARNVRLSCLSLF